MARWFKRFGKGGSFGGATDADYEKSNAIDAFAVPHLASSFRSAIVDAVRDTATYRQEKCQELVDYVCGKCGVKSVKVVVVDSPYPHKTTDRGTYGGGKLGHYVRVGGANGYGTEIRIWNLTAMRGKRISNKGIFGTATHELAHHLDYELLKLNRSIHTSGFYKRITALTKALEGGK